jgi:3D (Asp-Asp-Asp) domain-containing protein
MLHSHPVWRKLLATAITVAVVALVYEATVIDSKSVPPRETMDVALEPGSEVEFEATAYCKGHTTFSGVAVRAGIAAGDPRVLPIGSVIRVGGVAEEDRGVYTVLDTGPPSSGWAGTRTPRRNS